MRICEVCKLEKAEVRLDMQEGAWGPICRPICAECYARDAAERKAEARRFGFRPPRIVPFAKMDLCRE